MAKEALNPELDETIYEQDQDELDKAYRASRGDFIIDDEEEEKDSEESEDQDSEESEEDQETDEEEDQGEDSEEEKEEDGAEGEEEEDESDSDTSTEDNRIPLKRLNEVLDKARDLEDRNQLLEGKIFELLDKLSDNKTAEPEEEKLPPYDFDKAEEKYIELILEGEGPKAASLRREINEERELILTESVQSQLKSTQESAVKGADEVVQDAKFEVLIEALEAQHSFLNPENEAYSEDAVSMANDLMVGLMQGSGLTKAEALQKAVKRVAPLYSKVSLGGKLKAKKSRQSQAKKKAKSTDSKQPDKSLSSKSRNTNQEVQDIDVATLSDAEFAKLSPQQRARLRGDILE